MKAGSWVFAIIGCGSIAVGGPMMMKYIVPTEEELVKRYNPELRKRSEEGREDRLREANEFIDKIKEYSKDSRPIWTVWKEDAMRQKKAAQKAERAMLKEKKKITEEIRKQRLEGGE